MVSITYMQTGGIREKTLLNVVIAIKNVKRNIFVPDKVGSSK